ncbi:MAG: hypothetical protein WBG63_03590 [Phormidesmis sp.]
MKSSVNKSPVSFQDMKLQSVRPLKRLSRKLFQSKLLKQTRTRMGQIVSRKADALTKAAAFSAESKASKGSKLVLNLLLVRPWVLVIGFWLLSMGIGSLALDGMLSPRKLTMALPKPAAGESTSTGSNAALNVEQGSDEIAAESPVVLDAQETAVTTTASQDASRLPVVLPLVSLVGACAVGSLAISRRRAMIRMASMRANKGRVRKGQPRVVNSTAKASARSVQTRSMQAKSTQAKSTQVAKGARSMNGSAKNSAIKHASIKPLAALGKMRLNNRRSGGKRGVTLPLSGAAIAAQQSARGRVLTSRMNAQANAQTNGQTTAQKSSSRSQSRRRSANAASEHVPSVRTPKRKPKRSPARAANRQQPIVSVVPANETHALDWTRSSLAHQFDVRPQRSAM